MTPRRLILPFLLACLSFPLFFSQLADVPFHPDETSLLVQSHDLEALFDSPFQLAYQPNLPQSEADTYRALNAPLPKYVLGIGRRLAGYGPDSPSRDWNWSEDWEQNVSSGAMPAPRLLLGARAASALMAWLAMLCLYLAADSLAGSSAGVAASLLYATNALVLLHGRRAMAEGTLLFAGSAALLAGFYAHRRPFAGGITSGLATAAKHSGAAMLALNIVSASGLLQRQHRGWNRRLALVAAGFLLVTFALTPFLWRHPLAAVGRVVQARQQLLAEQVHVTETLAPTTVLTGWSNRWAGFLGGVYLGPLQFEEVGNYSQQLADPIENYRLNGWRTIGRGPIGGGVLLALTLLGIAAGFRGWLRPDPDQRARTAVLAVGSLLMAGVLWFGNPLPYQRYYLPLIPFVVLWESLGVAAILRGVRALIQSVKGVDFEDGRSPRL